MKKIILSLIAVCILTLPACGESTQSQFDIGEAALLDEDYKSAIDAFTQAIEDDPDLIEVYIERAKAYIGLGETEENLESAQKDYETALELDEENVDAELGLADVYIREGEYDAALEILEEGDNQSDGDEAIEDKIAEFDSDEIYDSSGNVRRQVARDDNGELFWYHNFTYDENGREISVTSFDFDGNQTAHIDFEYQEDGKQIVDYVTYGGPNGINVATIRSEEYEDDMPGSVMKVEREYDKDGNIIKEQTYNVDGTADILDLYEYNSAGQCIREQSYYGDNDMTECIYEYDENGNKVKLFCYINDGELYRYETYEYNEEGQEIKRTEYNPDDEINNYDITEYDSNGKRTKTSLYDKDDILSSYTIYKYDEDGGYIGEEEYDASGNSIYSVIDE